MLAASTTGAVLPPRVKAIVIDSEPLDLLRYQEVEVRRRSWVGCLGWAPCWSLLFAGASLDSILRGDHKTVFVPLRTCARLPSGRAKVAELVPAAAGHVEASVVELDEMVATGAPLPAELLR